MGVVAGRWLGRRAWWILPTLLLLGVSPRAVVAEPVSALATAQARAYVAALEAGGEEQAWLGLQAGDVDPWVVAEELLLLGKPALAAALAASPLTADAAELGAYVGRASQTSAALAEAVGRARERLAAGDAAAALAALPAGGTTEITVTGVRALLTRAQVLAGLDRADEALRARDDAALRAEALGWARAEIEARRVLLGEAELAPASEARHLARLLAIDRDARDLGRSAGWCARLGELEIKTGSLRTARRYLAEGDSLLGVLAQSPGLTPAQSAIRARTLMSLSHVHMEQGDSALCLDAALRAEDVARALEPNLRMRALYVLSDAYHMLRRLPEAVERLKAAVALAVESDGAASLQTMRLRGSLARLRLEKGETEEARTLYAQVAASEVIRKAPRARYVAQIHLAALDIDVPSDERTVEGLQRALLTLLEIERDLLREPATFAARDELGVNVKALRGRALKLLGRHADAEAAFRAVIESDYAAQAPELRRYAEQELVTALLGQGRAQEAHALSLTVLAAFDREVATLPDELALNTLAARRVDETMRGHVACALALQSPQAVGAAVEATRGIAFMHEVRRRRRNDRGSTRRADPREIAVLAADVGRAARAYWKARVRGGLKARREAGDDLWRARVRLRAVEERRALDDAVAAKEDAAKPRRRGPPPALRAGEAMLYLVESPRRYDAVVVRAGETRTVPLGARSKVDTELVRALETWMEADAAARPKAEAALLGAALPKPLVALLAPSAKAPEKVLEHIYVSASGTFARLPWPVLIPLALRRDGVAGTGPPGVSLMSCRRVLAHVRAWNPRPGPGPMLVLADPQYRTAGKRSRQVAYFGAPLVRLTETAKEGRAIADPERGDVLFLGPEASETNLRAELFEGEYPFDVLHLACHGLLYREVPWLSALALHPAPGEDGLLTVDEIGRWRFRTGPGLVVLSACESGLGAPVAGEGEEGLVRAFLLAGARNVVASLWKVPDEESRDLMIEFHRARREEGLEPVEALRAAQAVIAARKDTRPLDWAAWVVWGPRR